jgi:Pathogenicity locus.
MKNGNKEELLNIPGVGKNTKHDLNILGIGKVSDLKNKNPLYLYDRLCEITGKKQDRCVLYVYKCAVYYAEGGREAKKLCWWNWKD